MPLLDRNTWYILKHLHHSLAAQAASRIDAGESVPAAAYLVSPAAADDCLAQMHVAEVDGEFMAELLGRCDADQLLAQYLTDALQEGSKIQQHIAREHGLLPHYTVCVQETRLPNADSQTLPRPALLVLIRARNFVLPVFHLIRELPDGRRTCHVRPFPDLQEIEGAQHLLQAFPLARTTLQ